MIRKRVDVCSLSVELFLWQLRQAFIFVSFAIIFTPLALIRGQGIHCGRSRIEYDLQRLPRVGGWGRRGWSTREYANLGMDPVP